MVELDRLRAEAAAARAARDIALHELVALQDVVNQVKAICDMAEWAADVTEQADPRVTVSVSDLRRVLRGRS